MKWVHIDLARFDRHTVTSLRHRWVAYLHDEHGPVPWGVLIVNSGLHVFTATGRHPAPAGPFVDLVYVHPNLRRQGIATALYEEASRFYGHRLRSNGNLSRQGQKWAQAVKIPGRALLNRVRPDAAERNGWHQLAASDRVLQMHPVLLTEGKELVTHAPAER